jgi:very-short-patch-repair endonuclease
LGKQGLPRNLVNQLITVARKMRSEQTAAEKRLWHHIRERQLSGYKFRRQQVIDRFIVDFYCSEAKLIIEVDGEIHLKQKEQDKARDRFLQEIGYQVIRFSNQDIQNNLPFVLDKVQTICSQRTLKAT